MGQNRTALSAGRGLLAAATLAGVLSVQVPAAGASEPVSGVRPSGKHYWKAVMVTPLGRNYLKRVGAYARVRDRVGSSTSEHGVDPLSSLEMHHSRRATAEFGLGIATVGGVALPLGALSAPVALLMAAIPGGMGYSALMESAAARPASGNGGPRYAVEPAVQAALRKLPDSDAKALSRAWSAAQPAPTWLNRFIPHKTDLAGLRRWIVAAPGAKVEIEMDVVQKTGGLDVSMRDITPRMRATATSANGVQVRTHWVPLLEGEQSFVDHDMTALANGKPVGVVHRAAALLPEKLELPQKTVVTTVKSKRLQQLEQQLGDEATKALVKSSAMAQLPTLEGSLATATK